MLLDNVYYNLCSVLAHPLSSLTSSLPPVPHQTARESLVTTEPLPVGVLPPGLELADPLQSTFSPQVQYSIRI